MRVITADCFVFRNLNDDDDGDDEIAARGFFNLARENYGGTPSEKLDKKLNCIYTIARTIRRTAAGIFFFLYYYGRKYLETVIMI